MFIIIPFMVMCLLEFVVEPLFKVRKRLIRRFGSLPTGLTVIVLTFVIWYVLISQFPAIDDRIFTFTCVGIMVYFMPKKYDV
ncbi:hypothetical protein ACFYKX_04390 [Cytobacillus sp. FJAT-54145]|uniref:Uncharacterized protein n=1 Tax=Cytobacillus spartinae TaxID=3299023 RepID=A0ABW6KAU9_9BACI